MVWRALSLRAPSPTISTARRVLPRSPALSFHVQLTSLSRGGQMELEGEKAKLLKCSEFGQAIIDKM